jgi:hypothetical protein
MVAFWPVAVVSVKPEEDTLLIVPDDPPAAGPERALEPLPEPNPPEPNPRAGLLVAVVAGVLLEVAVTIP